MFNIYLNFDGNLLEAFEFYKDVFGGEFKNIKRYGDMPHGDSLSEVDKDKIMHVELKIGEEAMLMGSDILSVWGQVLNKGNDFYININPKDEVEGHKIFNKLAQGGEVQMPLQRTFWGSLFGTVTDKFGTQWMINKEL